MKNAPFQLISGNLPVSDHDFPRKDTLKGKSQHGAFFQAKIVGVIQVPYKHEIGHLLNDIQRVGETAGPEDFP